LRVNFDRTLKLKFLGSQVTTDAGLLAYRELDETLRPTTTGAESLQDSRLGQNKPHGLLPLLRQSIYSRLAGYEDVNDDWKNARRIVNILRLLPFGAYPSEAYMENPSFRSNSICGAAWLFLSCSR
jgi:hypothetical protein